MRSVRRVLGARSRQLCRRLFGVLARDNPFVGETGRARGCLLGRGDRGRGALRGGTEAGLVKFDQRLAGRDALADGDIDLRDARRRRCAERGDVAGTRRHPADRA